MKPHVVRQGDYLSKLAHLMRFDGDRVWADPKNAELKKQRDPNQLHPGDILFVPDSAPAPLPLRAHTANKYIAKVHKTWVRLGFKDEAGPFASEPYVIDGLGASREGMTDGGGCISIEVPVHVREISVFFPKRNVLQPVLIGDMDPIDEASGVRKRLVHLGFYKPAPGEATGDADPAAIDAAERRAITTFQREHGMAPTGVIDDALKTALVQAHGC